ncbi:PEPxxWA-CTERM sorting domain-containing protein [Sphingomonas sp. MMS24-J13]|uniref:PEPxxWA-CTERM sorting domain-containing protein n=1 Tax=Sphingomonas sp. MMS24-J13 TaxID=3238686 RepID=UPI00384D71A7
MSSFGKTAFRGVIGCALFAAMNLAAASVSATLLPQSWNGWKWSRTGPLAITLKANVSSAWTPYVTAAAAQWSKDQYIDYVVKAGTPSTSTTCAASYGTLQVCNANYGATGWVGYTQVWTLNNYIVQATVKLNEYYFSQPKYNTVAWRQLVTCQELGNALGLDDSDHNFGNANSGTCTDYTNDPTGKLGTNGTLANLAPDATDMANLDRIYSTLGTTQIASTKPIAQVGNAFLAVPVPEPASWMLMLGGFGIVGGAMRRTRPSARLA